MGESEWADVVGVVELAMNTAVAASTGEAPAKLDLGELPRLPVDVALDSEAADQPAAMNFLRMMKNLVAVTKERLYAAQERMATQANKHRRESTLAAGD